MPKKILLLADVNSSHTRKLVNGLAAAGLEIGLFSLSKQEREWFAGLANVTVFDQHAFPNETFGASAAQKIVYLKKRTALKKIIRSFQPDMLHAHYATSYGMLGWLSGFHPYIISSWGSDVLDFPKGSKVKSALLRKILKSADQLMVTSRTLEKAVKELTGRDSLITPFGIDTKLFFPFETERHFPKEKIVFGTVKSLEKIYGIDLLIRSFAELKKQMPDAKTALLIVGDGSEKNNLISLADSLGLQNEIYFAGRAAAELVPAFHNQMDVFMNLSQYESFGVSVLEAMACEKPVIVTDTGGLAEIVANDKDGIRVPVNDISATVEAMKKLLADSELRKRFGENGRSKVIAEYEWSKTISLMKSAYERTGGKS